MIAYPPLWRWSDSYSIVERDDLNVIGRQPLTFHSENEDALNREIASENKKGAKAPPGQHCHQDQQDWRSPAGCRESERD